MYVRKLDLMNFLISGSVCVGFKSSKSVIFLSQRGVLCFTHSSSIVFIKIFLVFAVKCYICKPPSYIGLIRYVLKRRL